MTAPAPIAGDVVADKYRIERSLGEGGMAVVFAATHLALGKSVALKFVRPWALGEAEARQRFLREAHATFSLRSEHAVRMLDLGELPSGDLFLVMELLEGQNLADVIRERGTLAEGEAATFIRQACDAIAEAHTLGIIHRDLKPANLFLTTTAMGKPCVKVLDFGLAKIVGTSGPGSVAPLTNMQTTLGTPKYMAPEQWERAARVDGRADIYSLGVILFQLLTGQVPHEELPIDERLRKILAGSVPSPRVLRSELSDTVSRIVTRCLRPLPEERFSSAQELAIALGAVAGVAVPSRPPEAWKETGITAVVPDQVRRALQREVDVMQGRASAEAASVGPHGLPDATREPSHADLRTRPDMPKARQPDDAATRREMTAIPMPEAASDPPASPPSPPKSSDGNAPMNAAVPGGSRLGTQTLASAGTPRTVPMTATESPWDGNHTKKMEGAPGRQPGAPPPARGPSDPPPRAQSSPPVPMVPGPAPVPVLKGQELARTLVSAHAPPRVPLTYPSTPPNFNGSDPPAGYNPSEPPRRPVPASGSGARAYDPPNQSASASSRARHVSKPPPPFPVLAAAFALFGVVVLAVSGLIAFFYWRVQAPNPRPPATSASHTAALPAQTSTAPSESGSAESAAEAAKRKAALHNGSGDAGPVEPKLENPSTSLHPAAGKAGDKSSGL